MKQELPAAARAEKGWPIRLDHCFMRVALDNSFGQCWYEVLDQRKGAVKSYVQLNSKSEQMSSNFIPNRHSSFLYYDRFWQTCEKYSINSV